MRLRGSVGFLYTKKERGKKSKFAVELRGWMEKERGRRKGKERDREKTKRVNL